MADMAALAGRPLQLDVGRLLKSRLLWCAAVAVFCALRTLGQDGGGLGASLGDTDDATRLVQVRELLAGHSWFDMTLARFGGAMPLVSHWSRLVDLPIALLIGLFQFFLTTPMAELATRILWPTLVLTAFLRLMVREVEFRGGQRAAVLFLVLAASCFSGLFQFNPGRIDHHNVMILGAVAGALALLRIDSDARAPIEAGVLLAVGLAVGFEALAIVVPLMALAAAWALASPQLRSAFWRFGAAFAAVLGGAFVLTTAPSHWLQVHCDALALNTVVLAAAGAAGFFALSRVPTAWPLWKAGVAVAAPVVVGCGLFAGLEPKCLAGPFGQIDPAIKPIWLDHVQETFSVWRMGRQNPLPAIVFILSQALGLLAAVLLFRSKEGTASFRGGLLVLMVVATLGALWQVKLIPYAAWLAIFALALAIARLEGTAQLSALGVQLAAVLIASQSLIGLVAVHALKAGGASRAMLEGKTDGDTSQCRSTRSVATLASLPRGFVVAPADLGPYVVALTPHDVLAAPYHRIGGAILRAHEIMTAEPAAAETRLRAAGADYLLLCQPDRASGQPHAAAGRALQDVLAAGGEVPYLVPVPLPEAARTLRAWRVVKR